MQSALADRSTWQARSSPPLTRADSYALSGLVNEEASHAMSPEWSVSLSVLEDVRARSQNSVSQGAVSVMLVGVRAADLSEVRHAH